ncbi:MAG: restriction endonuclease subunit S [Microbacterium sp.]
MTKLGTLVDQGDLTFSDGYRTKKSELANAGYAILRAADIANGRVSLGGTEFISSKMSRQIGSKVARDGDVILTTKGTVGRTAVVTGLDGRAAAYSPQVCYFRAYADSALRVEYLRYWFSSPEGRRQIRMFAGNTDMAPYLSLRDIAELDVRVPERFEQDAVCGILGALDDKIAANRSIVGAGLELLDTKFALASAGVEKVRISSIAQVVLGGTPSRGNLKYWDGNIPWINSGACNSRVITEASEMITGLGLEKSAAKLLPEGTTCVAITGATLGQMGWLANSMAANQSVVGVVAETMERLWVQLAVRSEREQLLGWATGGAQQHVNKNAVGSVEIAYEPACAVHFGEENDALMRRVVLAKQEDIRLAATRDELLPLLMSGKITVKDAEKTVEEVL